MLKVRSRPTICERAFETGTVSEKRFASARLVPHSLPERLSRHFSALRTHSLRGGPARRFSLDPLALTGRLGTLPFIESDLLDILLASVF